MQLKKMMMLLAAGSLAIAAQGLTLSVKDVKIAQRYPWNGLVDIDYTVECDDPDADVYVYPVGYDKDNNLSEPIWTLSGDGANGKAVKAGTHRMTWDMAKLDGITLELGRNDNAIMLMSPKDSQETAVINVVYASLQIVGFALDKVLDTQGIDAFSPAC